MSAASSTELVEGGELVYAGTGSWSLAGRAAKTGATEGKDGVVAPNLMGFVRLSPLSGVKITSVISGCVASHTFAIAADGRSFIWGRNENNQLGFGDRVNIYNPTPFKVSETDVVTGGACGAKHTLITTSSGTMFACGKNDYGQCGIGRVGPDVSKWTVVPIAGVTQAAAGRTHSLLLTVRRETYAFGCPEYGQLGNGTDGKMLERAGKITFTNEPRPIVVQGLIGVPVDAIACGSNHCVVADEEGKVYTWGFAGYGRLGHGDNKDQFEPKLLEYFANEAKPKPPNIPAFMWRSPAPRRAQHITCGATATYLIDLNGALYMWGITKKAGEAMMRPEVVGDVSGWSCRSVGCGNTSTIVAAEKSLITWGPSPTYGELGYGADGAKSSTRANEVEDIKGSHVVQVAMGYAHSCVIVKVEGDDALAVRGREAVAALPLYSPDEPDPATGVAAEAAASSGGGQSGPTGKRKVAKGGKGGKGKKKARASK